MPIVFTCICPHPALLISSANKIAARKLAKTKKAFKKLEEELYSAKPDALIVLTPHGKTNSDTIGSINQAPILKASFADFGDLQTKLEYKNNFFISYRIREACETTLALTVENNGQLDYGTSIPLKLLTESLKNFNLVSINVGKLNDNCQKFGTTIRKICEETNQRVAIIASANLSHRLAKTSEQGYSLLGKKFDQAVVVAIKDNQPEKLEFLNAEMIAESGQCGLEVIKLLYHIIGTTKIVPDVICYQDNNGIGYLSAQLII